MAPSLHGGAPGTHAGIARAAARARPIAPQRALGAAGIGRFPHGGTGASLPPPRHCFTLPVEIPSMK